MESETQSSAALDVWNLAKDLQKKQNLSSSSQKTIIVVGERSSGKTSFIRVLKSQSDSDVKPTCAVDYTFVRKTGVKKQIINCYEIVSRSLRSVLGVLITKQNFQDLHFVISIDMGQPIDLIESTLKWIQIVKEEAQAFLDRTGSEMTSRYQEARKERVADHEDASNIEQVPIATTLLINKYDLFERYQTEVRKWLSRTVRYLAHSNGCSVFSNSIKSSGLSAQVRSILSEFISSDNTHNLRDHLKPMFISFGNDSFNNMSLPHTGSMKMEDALKKQIQGLVGLKQEKKVEEFDFSKYREDKIDALIAEKEKEFERISKKNRAARGESSLVQDSPKRVFL